MHIRSSFSHKEIRQQWADQNVLQHQPEWSDGNEIWNLSKLHRTPHTKIKPYLFFFSQMANFTLEPPQTFPGRMRWSIGLMSGQSRTICDTWTVSLLGNTFSQSYYIRQVFLCSIPFLCESIPLINIDRQGWVPVKHCILAALVNGCNYNYTGGGRMEIFPERVVLRACALRCSLHSDTTAAKNAFS